MNEPIEQQSEQFSPEKAREARRVSDALEADAARRDLAKMHAIGEESTAEATARLYKNMEPGEKPGSLVHFEVAPDFPLPNKPIETEEEKARKIETLIQGGGDAYDLNKTLEDMYDQDKAA